MFYFYTMCVRNLISFYIYKSSSCTSSVRFNIIVTTDGVYPTYMQFTFMSCIMAANVMIHVIILRRRRLTSNANCRLRVIIFFWLIIHSTVFIAPVHVNTDTCEFNDIEWWIQKSLDLPTQLQHKDWLVIIAAKPTRTNTLLIGTNKACVHTTVIFVVDCIELKIVREMTWVYCIISMYS